MANYFEKKRVKEALEKAKELEKKKLLTPKEEVELQQEAVSFSEKLKKLLKPAWFVSDVHKKRPAVRTAKKVKKKAQKKTKKKTKKALKKSSPSTKKKKK